MPYLDKHKKEILKAKPHVATTAGHLTYLFTLDFIRRYKEAPEFGTIAGFLEGSAELINKVRSRIEDSGQPLPPMIRLQGAFDLAFIEFYRRVGSKHEDLKAEINGDVYVEEGLLDAKTGELVAFKAPVGTTKPVNAPVKPDAK